MTTQKAEEKLFGAAITLKYIGYAVLGISLAVIILASLLRIDISHTTTALLAGIFLIIIGYVAETFLGEG